MAAHGGVWRFGSLLCHPSFIVLLIVGISEICFQVTSISITTEVKIRTKIETASGCIDYDGNNRSHLESWPSSAGGCDNNICYFTQYIGIWIIQERCREIYSWENPDQINCRAVSDSSAAFPACCDVLQCDSSDPLTTLPPNYCYDRASALSCWFWGNVTNACIPSGQYYNFTKDYCKKTCGFC